MTFGAASLSISNKMLRQTEVELNMMRRFCCNCAKLDEFGHCYPIESLYCGTPRFSTVHRVSRAKIVGHILRHSFMFRDLIQWKCSDRKRNLSPSEACFHDLDITEEQALVYAQDRDHWKKLCEDLKVALEPLPDYERLSSPRWKSKHAHALKQDTPYDLQFVEESSDPFPLKDDEVHFYIDGSVRALRVTNEIRAGAGIVVLQRWTTDKCFSLTLDVDSAEQAEAESFREALKRIPDGAKDIVVHTDSFYVWNFFHHVRIRRRVIGYDRVVNRNILQDIDHQVRKLKSQNVNLYVCKVKSHNGNEYNDKADVLALSASRRPLKSQEAKRLKTTKAPSSSSSDPISSPEATLILRPRRNVDTISSKRKNNTTASGALSKKGSSLSGEPGVKPSEKTNAMILSRPDVGKEKSCKGNRESDKIVETKGKKSPKRKKASRKLEQ